MYSISTGEYSDYRDVILGHYKKLEYEEFRDLVNDIVLDLFGTFDNYEYDIFRVAKELVNNHGFVDLYPLNVHVGKH